MDSPSLHSIFILLHTVTAVICFLAGGLLLFSRTYATNRIVFGVYFWTLAAMAILLAGAIIIYWGKYSDTERIVFPSLMGLALFMLFRGWGAGLVLNTQQKGWKLGYVEHIGFTLISLFEGFVIVSGLNAGLPGWLVGILAVLGLLAGRWLIASAKRRTAQA
jgi:hypothetical protein